MFYFFFESRNSKNDPVVIWLTGGPGCSSELALFYENGPFKISNNLSLVWNDFGWDKVTFFILSESSMNLAIFLLYVIDNCVYIYICISFLQISNLIYVDQPTGTGFSYTSDTDDIRHDEQGVSNDLYDFLQVLSIGFLFFFIFSEMTILVPHRNLVRIVFVSFLI